VRKTPFLISSLPERGPCGPAGASVPRVGKRPSRHLGGWKDRCPRKTGLWVSIPRWLCPPLFGARRIGAASAGSNHRPAHLGAAGASRDFGSFGGRMIGVATRPEAPSGVDGGRCGHGSWRVSSGRHARFGGRTVHGTITRRRRDRVGRGKGEANPLGWNRGLCKPDCGASAPPSVEPDRSDLTFVARRRFAGIQTGNGSIPLRRGAGGLSGSPRDIRWQPRE